MSIFTRRHYDFLTETTKQIIEALDELYPKSPAIKRTIVTIIANNLAQESLGFNKYLFLENVLNHKQP